METAGAPQRDGRVEHAEGALLLRRRLLRRRLLRRRLLCRRLLCRRLLLLVMVLHHLRLLRRPHA